MPPVLSRTPYENHPDITPGKLKRLISYDPRTGALTWLINRARTARAGDEIGMIEKRTGYVIVTLFGYKIPAHRLVWFMTLGKWPEERLNCVNGKRDDLRLANWKLTSDNRAVTAAAMSTRRWREKRKLERDMMLDARVKAKLRELELERQALVRARYERDQERSAERTGPAMVRRTTRREYPPTKE